MAGALLSQPPALSSLVILEIESLFLIWTSLDNGSPIYTSTATVVTGNRYIQNAQLND
jgi:hypothetical protein